MKKSFFCPTGEEEKKGIPRSFRGEGEEENLILSSEMRRGRRGEKTGIYSAEREKKTDHPVPKSEKEKKTFFQAARWGEKRGG